MKVAPRQIAGFLRQPDRDFVLVYGPDQGLVRERADSLVAAVNAQSPDPFAITVLNGGTVSKDPALFYDEVAALSFGGGRRVVHVRDAGDMLTRVCQGLLEGSAFDAFIVIEAGNLPGRSSLRRLSEGNERAAAIPCYVEDGAGLEAVIVEALKQFDLVPDTDALTYLAANLGADRGITRREIEKLALYMGEAERVTLEDAMACVGDSGAASLEELSQRVAAGDLEGLERAMRRALGEGVSEIGILRAVAGSLRRIHLAVGLMGSGMTADQAMASLRPPIFFKAKYSFQAALGQWSGPRLSRALELLTEAELDCKTTGMPAAAVCGRALMRITQAARRPRRG